MAKMMSVTEMRRRARHGLPLPGTEAPLGEKSMIQPMTARTRRLTKPPSMMRGRASSSERPLTDKRAKRREFMQSFATKRRAY